MSISNKRSRYPKNGKKLTSRRVFHKVSDPSFRISFILLPWREITHNGFHSLNKKDSDLMEKTCYHYYYNKWNVPNTSYFVNVLQVVYLLCLIYKGQFLIQWTFMDSEFYILILIQGHLLDCIWLTVNTHYMKRSEKACENNVHWGYFGSPVLIKCLVQSLFRLLYLFRNYHMVKS